MIKKLKAISEVLPDLMFGIVVFAVLCELAGVWFVQRPLAYSLGILIGCILAEASTWYMANTIYRSLYMDEKGAKGYVTFHSILRYVLIIVMFGGMVFLDFADPLAAFLALMGIKAAAYMQPMIHKIFNK